MPLASLFALQWYGPACAAMVVTDSVGDMPTAAPTMLVRAGVTGVGTGDAPVLRPYRMRNFALTADGAGDMLIAAPRMGIRTGLVVKVSELSPDDVTGAVLEAKVEGDISLKQALRLTLAALAGSATGLNSSPVFKSQDGTKDRITSTLSGENRTITAVDAT